MNEIKEALLACVSTLSECASRTHHAANRPRYDSHLAQAALMFLAAYGKHSLEDLRLIVKQERHSFGWAMMEGDDGRAIESAFDVFARKVESA